MFPVALYVLQTGALLVVYQRHLHILGVDDFCSARIPTSNEMSLEERIGFNHHYFQRGCCDMELEADQYSVWHWLSLRKRDAAQEAAEPERVAYTELAAVKKNSRLCARTRFTSNHEVTRTCNKLAGRE
ncbi:hypothetical protein OK016_03715 [Vibrio chagasii]|nr:hypothetical protein [Vibrio chagasii]